jgi:hypothetical protein
VASGEAIAEHIHALRRQPALENAAAVILVEANTINAPSGVNEYLRSVNFPNYIVPRLRRDEIGIRTFNHTKDMLSEATCALLRRDKLRPSRDLVRVRGDLERFRNPQRRREDAWFRFIDQLRTWSVIAVRSKTTQRLLRPRFEGVGNQDDMVNAFHFSYTAAKALACFRNTILRTSLGKCNLEETSEREPDIEQLYQLRFFY